MVKFAKKDTPGAVGKLTKAEGLVAGGPFNMDILKQAIPDNLEELTTQIEKSHKACVSQMGRAVIIAGRAGQLLLAAKEKLPDKKPFTDWVAETFDFAWRTAYDYIKVSVALSRGVEGIEKCQSIREVLRLCDTEDGSKKKKKKDPKRESFVTWAAKIERWWAEENSESPVEEWGQERRDTCKKMLHGVHQIYEQL